MSDEELLNNLTVEEKKKYIQKNNELKISPEIIANLIISIKDIEYTEKCFKDREKLHLSSCDIINIISGLNDINFTKECIKIYRKLDLEQGHIIGLFEKLNNPKFTLECLHDEEIVHILNSSCIQKLIELCRDDDFTKKCIDEREKWGLTSKDIRWLIINMDDEDYTKAAIENYKKLDLNSTDLKRITCSIKDNKFLKQCIKDREKYGWDEDVICCMISRTDETYIKNCIEHSEQYGISSKQVVELISSLYEPEYTKKCIENKNLKFSPDEIASLILLIGNESYTKQCIEEKNFDFGSNELSMLITAVNDKGYTKRCIRNAKSIGLKDTGLLFLIESVWNDEFSKECILNWNKIGLNSIGMLGLILHIKDDDYVQQCLKNREKLHLDDFCVELLEKRLQNDYSLESSVLEGLLKKHGKIDNYINLPKEMTVGIEIESEGGNSLALDKLSNMIINNWICKSDGSLQFGIEIVSPILNSSKSSTEDIYKMCLFLSKYEQKITNRCGGHVHIGSNYLTDVQAMQNLVDLWTNCEKCLFIISNAEGDIPRDDFIEYAEPISKKMQDALNKGCVNLNDESDLKEFIKDLRYVQQNRFSSINFMNLDYGRKRNNPIEIYLWKPKNTFEFRLSNSTLNPDVWIQNINLYGGIVKAAQDIYEISQKDLDDITEDDKIKLELFEKIKDNNTSEQDRLSSLLKLAIPQEKRSIYIKRYVTNKKLLEQNEELSNKMNSRISNKKINTSKNQIKKSESIGDSQLVYNQINWCNIIQSEVDEDEFER